MNTFWILCKLFKWMEGVTRKNSNRVSLVHIKWQEFKLSIPISWICRCSFCIMSSCSKRRKMRKWITETNQTCTWVQPLTQPIKNNQMICQKEKKQKSTNCRKDCNINEQDDTLGMMINVNIITAKLVNSTEIWN